MIKKLIITNLYGKNYNLDFKDDLTIFYGRNGSGKTTILNIIQLLLEGEIKKVCGYSFDSLSMTLVSNQQSSELEIYREETEYIISFKNMKIKLKKSSSNLNAIYHYKNSPLEIIDESSNSYNLDSEFNKVKILSMDEADEKKVDLLMEYFNKELSYIYIPLDRKVRKSNQNIKKNKLAISQKRNIEDSLKMAESYFADFKNHINQIENNINNKMRTQIFNQLSRPIEYDKIGDFTKLNQSDFEGIENLLGKILGNEFKDNIKELSNLFHITRSSYKVQGGKIEVVNTKDFITHTFTVAQLNKLKNVIAATTSTNQKLNNFKNIFKEVLENINKLFLETKKTIVFDNINQRLYFKNEGSKQKLEMSLLSSGEKQLVIFFIFSLIDYRRNNNILLIDEPEVSLHIEWQEKLLPSIMENSEKYGKKQIIIATHSPDIIGKYVDRCIEIKGESL